MIQQLLCEEGYIYKGNYEGWYSVPDEAFLSHSQVTDGMEPGSKVQQHGPAALLHDLIIVVILHRCRWNRAMQWNGRMKKITCSDCLHSVTSFCNGLTPNHTVC